ncbi:GTP-binding protein YPTC1, putative [Entamoeba dispar SAW760]|uniref:GTP-binding protein YPTC1, putative n=1 Tax=Entamoeba dispar (strain ATCC PRA-260 / SAW760) TaxID=370354 RepID=B0EIV2_ENTDS|nr:GTP-binding protein YPTC1, putative [Entamoeba dispar SAW760]EDR25554.1 GTP-binding protein YPTC1, putative [Entamoeba dispar SAW760]|eukprot:EDR25554.1 GTP-binding protein YPTC1, putative [Entamoeba dispar SAW760]
MTHTYPNFNHLFKILIIGESGVGKTALMQRFCDNIFEPCYMPTVGVDFKLKLMKLNNEIIKMQLWDTAGQERFRNITSSYYRGTQGVLIVYDVTDTSTFDQISSWFNEVMRKTEHNPPVIYIIGNKMDLKDRICVQPESIERLVKKIGGIKYFFISAKDGNGVEDIFSQLGFDILQKKELIVTNEKQCVIQPYKKDHQNTCQC